MAKVIKKKANGKGNLINIALDLVKPAKKTGGDRYGDGENFSAVYVSQDISRDKDGEPKDRITMGISMKAKKGYEKYTLEREAKKEGGDRYIQDKVKKDTRPQIFYIPQEISRHSGETVDALYINFK